jgi:type II secretory pathway pseudopilin PulG
VGVSHSAIIVVIIIIIIIVIIAPRFKTARAALDSERT